VTVTERLSDLRTEAAALRSDLHRLAEVVYRIAGRLDGIEQRFSEVDKRIDLAVKLAVREELDRRAIRRRNDRPSLASAGRPALAIIHLPSPCQRWRARLAALATALSEAVTMLPSMPTP
jgi:hypothetical protein